MFSQSVEGQPGSSNYHLNRYTNYSTSTTVNPFTQVGAVYFVTDRLAVEAFSQSIAFPFSFGGFNLGLSLLTGGTAYNPAVTQEVSPQTERGHWVLSGSFRVAGNQQGSSQDVGTAGSGSNSYSSDSRASVFTTAPSVGVFIRNNRLLGVAIPVSFQKSRVINRSGIAVAEESETSIGVQPYLKQYAGTRRLRPFVEGHVGYRQGTLRRDNTGQGLPSFRIDQRSIEVGGSAGLAYMLRERFIVEATLGSAAATRFTNAPQQADPENRKAEGWTLTVTATLQPAFSLVYIFR
ncbi:hypothetical protein [Nibrella viscosa]